MADISIHLFVLIGINSRRFKDGILLVSHRGVKAYRVPFGYSFSNSDLGDLTAADK